MKTLDQLFLTALEAESIIFLKKYRRLWACMVDSDVLVPKAPGSAKALIPFVSWQDQKSIVSKLKFYADILRGLDDLDNSQEERDAQIIRDLRWDAAEFIMCKRPADHENDSSLPPKKTPITNSSEFLTSLPQQTSTITTIRDAPRPQPIAAPRRLPPTAEALFASSRLPYPKLVIQALQEINTVPSPKETPPKKIYSTGAIQSTLRKSVS